MHNRMIHTYESFQLAQQFFQIVSQFSWLQRKPWQFLQRADVVVNGQQRLPNTLNVFVELDSNSWTSENSQIPSLLGCGLSIFNPGLLDYQKNISRKNPTEIFHLGQPEKISTKLFVLSPFISDKIQKFQK